MEHKNVSLVPNEFTVHMNMSTKTNKNSQMIIAATTSPNNF